MNAKQVEWARKHDWFRDYLVIGTNYYGRKVYRVSVQDNSESCGWIVFDSYTELRAWAGY